MPLLNTTQQEYYQGNDFGNYQFTSLQDIINQFMFIYVGEDKIIPKAKRLDVAFHAQRALAELSFDTFKSVKSQQIDLPGTLIMPIPHDYISYTKISFSDSSGIKRPLYPISATSNPFQIRQEANGDYSFPSGSEILKNADFSSVNGTVPNEWSLSAASGTFGDNSLSSIGIDDGKLKWSYSSSSAAGGGYYTHVGIAYQVIDVSGVEYIDLSADGVTSDISFTNPNTNTGTAVGTIRFGISTTPPDVSNLIHVSNANLPESPLTHTSIFDLVNIDGDEGYLEWTGSEDSTKTINAIDVSGVDTVYALALSFVDSTTKIQSGFSLKPASNPNGAPTGTLTTPNINSLDNLSIINTYASTSLQSPVGNEKNSSTWNNYKSNIPSENNNYEDYEDDNTYWPDSGRRYGLDPEYAQVNGSFYIDERLGNIHFSSNISGKTVILDYISDSLGTEDEMKVHKFAEEAMYKYISYAILSGRANISGQIIQRLKKEKFAAVRTAKLRLSNLNLRELTQVLRGKSKWIKH